MDVVRNAPRRLRRKPSSSCVRCSDAGVVIVVVHRIVEGLNVDVAPAAPVPAEATPSPAAHL